jgi:UDP:flavonoid glycosyltransferase YjiC (YdhE family)
LESFDGTRLYFSPCGIGLGHASRSVPLAQEFVKRGSEVLFSTYHEAVDYIQKYNLPVMDAPSLEMENDPTGSIDLKATTLGQSFIAFPTFYKQVRFEIQAMQYFEPDLVFSDTRLSTIYAARLLKIPCILLLNQFLPRLPREKDTNFFRIADGTILTILGRSWALSNLLIIPDFPQPYTISLDSLRIPRRYGVKVQLVGSILPQKPEEIPDSSEIRARLGINDEEFLIYATMSGPRAERVPIINILEPIFKKFPKPFKVVMSLGIPNGGAEPVEINQLTKIPWIENRFEYMKACDLVISRGGHETIMQTICYQKPSIIIPVPKHPEQYGNARRAMELGIAKAVHQREIQNDFLLGIVKKMLRNEDYKKNLEQMNINEDLGSGLEHIFNLIASYLTN